MADFESLLNRWQTAGVLDAEAAGRIRAYEAEQKKPAGLRWQGHGRADSRRHPAGLRRGALCLRPLGRDRPRRALCRGAGHGQPSSTWAEPGRARAFAGSRTALHAVGTLSTGAAIALVGQIFNIQEHWPAAVLLWAVAALAGWILLHDEAQQTLTLLLVPGVDSLRVFLLPPKATSAKTSMSAASWSSGRFFT